MQTRNISIGTSSQYYKDLGQNITCMEYMYAYSATVMHRAMWLPSVTLTAMLLSASCVPYCAETTWQENSPTSKVRTPKIDKVPVPPSDLTSYRLEVETDTHATVTERNSFSEDHWYYVWHQHVFTLGVEPACNVWHQNKTVMNQRPCLLFSMLVHLSLQHFSNVRSSSIQNTLKSDSGIAAPYTVLRYPS